MPSLRSLACPWTVRAAARLTMCDMAPHHRSPAPTINGVTFVSSTSYAATMTVGTVVEYSLRGTNAHPFHNHINSFQLVTVADSANGYFQVGDWHDVLISPNNQMTVRLQTDRFIGKQVCARRHRSPLPQSPSAGRII